MSQTQLYEKFFWNYLFWSNHNLNIKYIGHILTTDHAVLDQWFPVLFTWPWSCTRNGDAVRAATLASEESWDHCACKHSLLCTLRECSSFSFFQHSATFDQSVYCGYYIRMVFSRFHSTSQPFTEHYRQTDLYMLALRVVTARVVTARVYVVLNCSFTYVMFFMCVLANTVLCTLCICL